MPVRLKSLELQGYKTFASRTLFAFDGAITAIVGPNGSGKSNIADALRWVLGEQSARLMRASKTEDMIFSGSQQRPRAGMAAATVIFDNSDGWLPIEFSEVAITRRAYRDGRNEYRLNGQPVRLRDLRELLAQAGLSQRTYTILGQGMVDASLALKAEDRRALFEEAAGVGLYRSRRAEALRRLETTRRNLERVLDIMAEIKPRLRYLERQARKAQEHAALQADLRILLRDWYGYHWHRAQRELLSTRHTLQTQEKRRAQARAEHQAVQKELQQIDEALRHQRQNLQTWRRERSQAYRQLDALRRELAVLQERQRAHQLRQAEAASAQQRLEDEAAAAQQRLETAQKEVERRQNEMAQAKKQLQAAQQALKERLQARQRIRQQTEAQRQQLDALVRSLAETRAREENYTARLAQLTDALAQLEAAEASARRARQQAERQLAETERALQAATTAQERARTELKTAQQQAQALEQKRLRLQEAIQAEQAAIARLQAELDILQQAEATLKGYAEGARHLLTAIRQGELDAHPQALGAGLHVPAEIETAIAAALGDFVAAILLPEEDALTQALQLLRQAEDGRAALILPRPSSTAPGWQPPQDARILGLAADLVEAPPALQAATRILLGQTLIVRDQAAALALLPRVPVSVRIVTLAGELFARNGTVLAGPPPNAGTLSRTRRQRQLEAELAQRRNQLAEHQETLAAIRAALQSAYETLATHEKALAQAEKTRQAAQKDHEAARLQVNSARQEETARQRELEARRHEANRLQTDQAEAARRRQQLEAKRQSLLQAIQKTERQLAALPIDELQAQVTYWEKRLAVAEQAHNDARRRLEERQQAWQQLQQQRRQLQTRQQRMDEEAQALAENTARLQTQLQQAQDRLQAIQERIRPAEAAEQEAEENRTHLQAKLDATQRQLQLAERTFNQVQLDLTRRQEALQTLRQRIEEDFGLVLLNYEPEMSGPMPLPLGDLVEDLPRLETLPPNLEKDLKEKRAILRRMGAINHEARAEYEKESQRYAFMEAQVADLQKAEADLRQVIAELDELTRQAFMKTYEAVSRSFSEIFRRLFDGGSARLILTDPDNLTETGVEIEARLPGRRRQGLALLSGGERSLTAIALVFALIKVSPTPICVMDEVDAMLDEANVVRFRDLLTELSQETQFILITHNRNTVQAADVIYGVTMGRDSVSQVVSLRLDEISDAMLQGKSAPA